MQEKYYLDACIWIDYFENRSDKFRPLGDWAFTLIRKIIDKNDFIILSDLLFEELAVYFSKDAIENMISICPEEVVIRISTTSRQLEEAKIISRKFRTPLKDTLHAIIARDCNSILVTRDKHFAHFDIKAYKPEELI